MLLPSHPGLREVVLSMIQMTFSEVSVHTCLIQQSVNRCPTSFKLWSKSLPLIPSSNLACSILMQISYLVEESCGFSVVNSLNMFCYHSHKDVVDSSSHQTWWPMKLRLYPAFGSVGARRVLSSLYHTEYVSVWLPPVGIPVSSWSWYSLPCELRDHSVWFSLFFVTKLLPIVLYPQRPLSHADSGHPNYMCRSLKKMVFVIRWPESHMLH
jgi:hypothetical protein